MCVKSGYKTVSPIQITNCLHAYFEKQISYRAVRIYFACLSLVAIREAAARSQKQKGRPVRPESRFRFSELAKITGLKQSALRKELRSLKSASILACGEKVISVNPEIIPGSEELLGILSCKRSSKRPIPFPRSVIAFIAKTSKASLGLAILAYVLRGLTIERKGGAIGNAGSVKASWIAETFGLSLRSAKTARKELIELGFIEKDTTSIQRKLNRTGAYFRVNLLWNGKVDPAAKIAPLPLKKCAQFALPYKDMKTSYEIKNQKAKSCALKRPGVCKANIGREPTLRDVRPEDLRSFSRAKALFLQAVRAGWLIGSEADFLNWMGAAVRANAVNARDPIRVFISIVRGRRWEFISQAQEDRARIVITRSRDATAGTPEMFHAHRGTMEAASVTLSKLKL